MFLCIPKYIYIYTETQHTSAVIVWKAAPPAVTKTWYLRVNIKHLNWKIIFLFWKIWQDTSWFSLILQKFMGGDSLNPYLSINTHKAESP